MNVRTRKRLKAIGSISLGVLLAAVLLVIANLSSIGAYLILHPLHRHTKAAPPAGCVEVDLEGAGGVILKGWRGEFPGTSRGTVIYLHGIADNRASGAGVIERFLKRGFDVLSYDSRAHGESGGDACTYGYFEKGDLRKILDTVKAGPVILIGSSLGGAVSLQAAADDKRISAVVSAEAFSDLRKVAIERAPSYFTSEVIERSFVKAEKEANFRIENVSPATAAKKISVPVLIIHGAEDVDTPPEHGERIFSNLAGPRQWILVPGAHHNESLSGVEIWKEIEGWIDRVVPPVIGTEKAGQD